MRFSPLCSASDLAALVRRIGFLPFFRNCAPGFSVEELTPRSLWFSDTQDGPWDWKDAAIRESGGLYGKLFRGKAGYVSAEWFPDLANYRRDGYDFEGYYEDGHARHEDKRVMDAIDKTGPILTKALRREAGFLGKDGSRAFEAALHRLQMQCFLSVVGFEYARDASGKEYGWGIARCATPEQRFGPHFLDEAYKRDPRESFERIINHLRSVLPDAPEEAIRKLLK